MKIALVSYEFPPDTGFGGIGTYTWYQSRALVRLGHDVHVIAGSLRPGIFHEEHEGVQITRVLSEGGLAGAIAGLSAKDLGWAPIRLRNAAGAFVAMRELLERDGFDMVEYPECGADGMLVSTLLPVRSCVRFHSPARLIMTSYGAGPRDLEVTTFLEQVAIDRAVVRTSPSQFLVNEVTTHLDIQPPVHVIANGIDLELFDQVDEPGVLDRFGVPVKDTVTILFASRLETRKGVHLLPEIFLGVLHAFPHVRVVVAGGDVDGAIEKTIRPLLEAHGLGDRLHFLGRLGLDDVRALGKHVDIHLLPTLWDNAPYSCIEAMASGRAIIASDCGGMPEMIDHGANGLLATTGDAASFVEGLSHLVEDRALRERLGAAARRTVEERYLDVDVAGRTVELWEQTIASSSLP